jgi:hypothetical protein
MLNSKNSMKGKNNKAFNDFVLKAFLVFAVVAILDYVFGNILEYYYFKQESGLQYRTTYSMEHTNEDVLIFGASRANHHYHPDVFEKRLNMSYYNVGRDGNPVFYHYAVLKCILKRYTPKIIVMDFTGEEFRKDQQSYDRMASLLPYYKKHPEIRSIIELRSPYEKIKLLSSIYPYNSAMFTIAVGNAEFNKKRRGDIKGYVPLTGVWNEPIITDNTQSHYEVDSNKVNAYTSFIKDCINAGTRLYIVCSPYYFKTTQTDISFALARDIAEKNKIPFFNFFKDSAFTSNHTLFSDMVHLNDDGARVFSNKVIDRIMQATDNDEIKK